METQFEELRLAGNLPSPSGVGMAILRLTQDDDYTAEQLAHTIQSDPALTGRIVKMANSAQLAASRPVTVVSDAVVRLGLRTVRNVALGFSLVSSHRDGKCRNFDYQRYWSQSLARAIAAQRLCSRTKGLAPAEAYICGLLAEIGGLALACVHPDTYSRILASVPRGDDRLLAAAEQGAFAIDHGEVAWCLLNDWNMPRTLCDAIHGYWRELPDDDSSYATLARVLRLADTISRVLVDADRTQEVGKLREVAGPLGLESDEDLFSLCDAIAREWIEWGRVLGVTTNEVPPFAEIAASTAEEGSPSQPFDDDSDGDEDAALGQLLVLAVDDDPVSLRMMVAQIKKGGHQVLSATNGADALTVALEQSPHILVTDWMMPVMNGLELVRNLRRTELGRDMYIIVLTGANDDDQVIEAFRAGADDYVNKPCKTSILVSRISAGERLIRLRDELARDKKRLKRQMAELAILNRKLNHTAVTDALTDLPNRRFAMSRLEENWSCATSTMSLIMIDIDKFKGVNDTYGHDVGDHVLREVAAVLQAKLRGSDTVARIGGEEFVVLCPGCPLEAARQVAERLRVAVEEHPISFGGFEGRVTLSLGVAQRAPSMTSQEDLLKAADMAVYQAKRSGRNQVVCATPAAV